MIDGLGYSGASVTLSPFGNHLFEERKPFLEYEFSVDRPGDYEVQIRFLPTHANDFDFEVGVAVNGESRKDFCNQYQRAERRLEGTCVEKCRAGLPPRHIDWKRKADIEDFRQSDRNCPGPDCRSPARVWVLLRSN